MNSDFASIEKQILELWNTEKVFEEINRVQIDRPLFNFFDGPPFATGLPHYGHILASTVKDIVLRFMSQSGYKVVRDFGWDTHGLPVEYEIDKSNNFTLQDIRQMGISKYNELCRSIVLKYTNEWKQTIRNLGRWTTYGYRTMDSEFMESVWRVFKVLFDMGLVYKGYRVMPYSTACTTPLSNFEANQNYKEVEDPAVFVKFALKKKSITDSNNKHNFTNEIKNESDIYHQQRCESVRRVLDESIKKFNLSLLVFTTTPWTLPSNCGLAINKDFEYSVVESHGSRYVLLHERVSDFFEIQGSQDLDLTQLSISCPKNRDLKHIDQHKNDDSKETDVNPLDRQIESDFGAEIGTKKDKTLISSVIITFRGSILLYYGYEPLFLNFTRNNHFFNILNADFIDASTGTGVVHLAPGFGDEDYNCFVSNKIIQINSEVPCPVDESGRLTIDPMIKYGSQSVISNLFGKETTVDHDSIKKGISHSKELNKLFNNITKTLSGTLCTISMKENNVLKLNLKNFHVKETDLSLVTILAITEKLFKFDKIVHRYPFCWRSDTPLIYKAIPNWFIKVSKFTNELVQMNEQINWVPKSISKKFSNWLTNARDWSVSRNRFWGTPLPIWQHQNEFICVGSIKELEDLSGVSIFNNKLEKSVAIQSNSDFFEVYNNTDIHRESIDHITIEKDGKLFKRVDEVMDCWFESGSMPYYQKRIRDLLSANVSLSEETQFTSSSQESRKSGIARETTRVQLDYLNPITDPEKSHIYHISDKTSSLHLFRKQYANLVPATFIAEGIDQTRGWFYTLHVLSTIIFNKPAFQNVICNGIVLAQDGKKMSKRLKNYPDPTHILTLYGADSLRLCLISSPVVMAENLLFNEDRVKNIQKSILLPLFNALKFYLDSGCVADFEENQHKVPGYRNIHDLYDDKLDNSTMTANHTTKNTTGCPMDAWILQRVENLCAEIQIEMRSYVLNGIQTLIVHFIDDLNNWYIRVKREKIRKGNNWTLQHVLIKVSVILAPFMPFFSEFMFQQIVRKIKSLNLCLTNSECLLKDDSTGDFSQKTPEASQEISIRSVNADNLHTFLKKDTFVSVHYMQFKPCELKPHIFEQIKEIINGFRFIREQNGISLKTPLRHGFIVLHDSPLISSELNLNNRFIAEFASVIKQECNLLDLQVSNENEYKFKEEWLPNFETIKENKKEKILLIRSLDKNDIHSLLKYRSKEFDLQMIKLQNKVKSKKEKKKTYKNNTDFDPIDVQDHVRRRNSTFENQKADHKLFIHIDEILYKKTLTEINYPHKTSESFTLILNTDMDLELISMRNAREFNSWLQKLRKNNNLKIHEKRAVWLNNENLRESMKKYYPKMCFVDTEQFGEVDLENRYEFDGMSYQVKLFKL